MDRKPMWRLSRRSFLTAVLTASAAALVGTAQGGKCAMTALAEPTTPSPGGDPDALFAELDAYLTQRMADLKIPGVAVGVIAGGREHTAGFGVTSVDHPLPVDANTLFQIGSTTKTF